MSSPRKVYAAKVQVINREANQEPEEIQDGTNKIKQDLNHFEQDGQECAQANNT